MLADAGLVERQGIEGGRPGAFVLALTAEGRRVAKGESRPELALPSPAARRLPKGRCRGGGERTAAPPASAPAVDADPALLERLKTWRREEARQPEHAPVRDLPRQHARGAGGGTSRRPARALRQVRGVGPAKLEAFGAALLEVLGYEGSEVTCTCCGK